MTNPPAQNGELPPRHSVWLLVSVRDAREAEAALAGGAAVIDVKEPSRGPLGAADAEVLSAVVQAIGGRRPVTAAAGELNQAGKWQAQKWQAQKLEAYARPGLSLVKFGLAGLAGRSDWLALLRSAAGVVGEARLVPVAYADHERCRAPRPADVLAAAAEAGCRWLMLDTAGKRAGGLFDCMSEVEVGALVAEAHRRGLRAALAGRLSLRDVRRAAALAPDLVGVRGAACGGDRLGRIDADLVQALSAAVACPRRWDRPKNLTSPSESSYSSLAGGAAGRGQIPSSLGGRAQDRAWRCSQQE